MRIIDMQPKVNLNASQTEAARRYVNDNIAEGLASIDPAVRSAAANAAWQLGEFDRQAAHQTQAQLSQEQQRTQQLALSAMTVTDIQTKTTYADAAKPETPEALRQQYADFTRGKVQMLPKESLALRDTIVRMSADENQVLPELTQAESTYLSDQRQRAENDYLIAEAGPLAGAPAALASQMNAPPEVVAKFVEAGVGLVSSGGLQGIGRGGRSPQVENRPHNETPASGAKVPAGSSWAAGIGKSLTDLVEGGTPAGRVLKWGSEAAFPPKLFVVPQVKSSSQVGKPSQEPPANQQTVTPPPLWTQRQHQSLKQAGFIQNQPSPLETGINQARTLSLKDRPLPETKGSPAKIAESPSNATQSGTGQQAATPAVSSDAAKPTVLAPPFLSGVLRKGPPTTVETAATGNVTVPRASNPYNNYPHQRPVRVNEYTVTGSVSPKSGIGVSMPSDKTVDSPSVTQGSPLQITHDDKFVTFRLQPLAVDGKHEIPISLHFPKDVLDPKTNLPPNFEAINAEMGVALKPNFYDRRATDRNRDDRLKRTEAVDVYYLGPPKITDTAKHAVLNNNSTPQTEGDRVVIVQRLSPGKMAVNQAPIANIAEGSIRWQGDPHYNPTVEGASFSVAATVQQTLSRGLESLSTEGLRLSGKVVNLKTNLEFANSSYPHNISRWFPDQPQPSRLSYITRASDLQRDMVNGITQTTEGYRDFKPRNNVYTEAQPTTDASALKVMPPSRSAPFNPNAFTSESHASAGLPPIRLTYPASMQAADTKVVMPPRTRDDVWTEVTLPKGKRINDIPKDELNNAIYRFVIDSGGNVMGRSKVKELQEADKPRTDRTMTPAVQASISGVELIHFGPRKASEKGVISPSVTVSDNRVIAIVHTLNTDGTPSKLPITLMGAVHPKDSFVYNDQVSRKQINESETNFVVAGNRTSIQKVQEKLTAEIEVLNRLSENSFGGQRDFINRRRQELVDTLGQFNRAIEPMQPSHTKTPDPVTPIAAPKAEPHASTGTLPEALAYLSEGSRKIVTGRIDERMAQQTDQNSAAQSLLG